MTGFFSGTVGVAIFLFILKEIREMLRQGKINGRRKLAIRTLLSAELERDHYAIKTLREIITAIEEALANGKQRVEIARDPNSRVRIKVGTDDHWTSWQVPTVHSDVLAKNIMELAVLDKFMFELALKALDQVSELDHLRESLVDQVTSRTEGRVDHLGSFPRYAYHLLDTAYDRLDRLYTICAGRRLETIRVR